MTKLIHLTADDANKVRMLSRPGHACAPVPLKDGTLILPVEMLNDPMHVELHDFLATLPQIDVDPSTLVYADGAQYPTEFAACQYNESWPAGVPIIVNLPVKF